MPPLGRLALGTGLALSAVGTVAVGGALALARAITGPQRSSTYRDYVFTPFEAGIPFQGVGVPAADGTRLAAWWMPQGQRDRVVICCPYYRGHKSALMGIAGALWRAGFSTFLFDYRGHGEHVGTPVTLGYREVEDLLAAVEVVQRLAPGAALGAIGYSMGAAVAIMGAARQPAIQAVVADGAFARQSDAIRTGVREQLGVPIDPLMPLIELIVHTRLGYRFSDVQPLRDVANLNGRPLLIIHGEADEDVQPLRDVANLNGRPLLIIHGEADEVVQVEQAHRLYAAATPPKELWALPGVGHCGAYFEDRTTYCARVTGFFDQTLTGSAASRPPSGDPEGLGARI